MSAFLRSVALTAWQDVRSQSGRALLSVLGLMVAIIAVIVVNSASLLSRRANEDFIAWQYGRPVSMSITANVAWRGELGGRDDNDMPVEGPSAAVVGQATDELREVYKRNGIPWVSLLFGSSLWIEQGETLQTERVLLVSPDIVNIRVVNLVAGEFPQQTASGQAYHAIVSQRFADGLGLTPAEVIGRAFPVVTPQGGNSLLDPYRDAPRRTLIVDAVAEWAGDDAAERIWIVADHADPAIVEGAGNQIHLIALVGEGEGGLPSRLYNTWTRNQSGLLAITEPQFVRTDMAANLEPLLSQQSVTAQAVSLIAMVVGGLGVLSVGLANVRQRQHEFGVRRAFGTDPARIFVATLTETLINVTAALLLAIPLAGGIVIAFSRQLVLASLPVPQGVIVPAGAVVIGAVSALVIGVLAGLVPAARAARMSVIDAIRT